MLLCTDELKDFISWSIWSDHVLKGVCLPFSDCFPFTLPSQETMENVKKCKNFLSTLIKLASSGKQSTETAANVKELVQSLLVRKAHQKLLNTGSGQIQTQNCVFCVFFLIPWLEFIKFELNQILA